MASIAFIGSGGTGKTTVALGVARSLAYAGQRVLVADLDDIAMASDALLAPGAQPGTIPQQSAWATADGRLDVIGDRSDPQQVFHAAVSLADRYDWIIYDAGAGTDLLNLAEHLRRQPDAAVVYVGSAKEGERTRQIALRLLDGLEAAGVPLTGLVINRVGEPVDDPADVGFGGYLQGPDIAGWVAEGVATPPPVLAETSGDEFGLWIRHIPWLPEGLPPLDQQPNDPFGNLRQTLTEQQR